MLAFHPDDRVTVEEALDHAYFSEFKNLSTEPVAKDVLKFELDKQVSSSDGLSESELRAAFLEEVKQYRECQEQDEFRVAEGLPKFRTKANNKRRQKI